MAKKKILDFGRVGSSVNTTSLKTVGKVVAGGLIGEALPSVFQRISGVQSSGVAGNAVSGAITTVLFLAMNQKEMAAGVVATKIIKATIAYGNPVVARVTGVPLALPSTNDGYTVNMNQPDMANATMGDDIPFGGTDIVRLPNGQQINVRPRDENPTVNYDVAAPAQLSEFLSAADLASLSDGQISSMYGSDADSMLSDSLPVFGDDFGF